MKIDECYIEKLIRQSLDNYTILNFNFKEGSRQAEFTYREKMYRVQFIYYKNDQQLKIHSVWNVFSCSIYHTEITDFIEMCIKKQIEIESLKEKLAEK
jgi:hypothetical protein